ncbi:MAG: UDP-N-acetylglucosamine 2-epimerase (non-hydrolyzing) [Legionella sp.]|nr:UDP-N-acetylglucosamine 2-epimerase (non-hydrolyzing) [Legionella sp.]
MKICTIVGARPQFIKAAAVSRAIKKYPTIEEVLIHTGQHYDNNMSEQFFVELDIPKPKHHLNIGSSSHGKQTGQMLDSIESVLIQENPDWVLIYGDTNSTLAGALAAAKLNMPVAHVEAGLRSFNRKMPEEINRITADHVSQILFVPTKVAHEQLLKEGMDDQTIFNVGDVMYDATLYYNEFNAHKKTILQQLSIAPQTYVLATIHRAENTDHLIRLKNICDALIELSTLHKVILPLHPRTRGTLKSQGLLETLQQHVCLLEPVGFLDMLALEQNALCIITDSGGVQKEAYFNQIPCITLRNETEWVELVQAGWNQLCPPDSPFSLIERITAKVSPARHKHTLLYGQGNAAEKILEVLLQTINH